MHSPTAGISWLIKRPWPTQGCGLHFLSMSMCQTRASFGSRKHACVGGGSRCPFDPKSNRTNGPTFLSQTCGTFLSRRPTFLLLIQGLSPTVQPFSAQRRIVRPITNGVPCDARAVSTATRPVEMDGSKRCEALTSSGTCGGPVKEKSRGGGGELRGGMRYDEILEVSHERNI